MQAGESIGRGSASVKCCRGARVAFPCFGNSGARAHLGLPRFIELPSSVVRSGRGDIALRG